MRHIRGWVIANVGSKEEGSEASRSAAGLGHRGSLRQRHEVLRDLAATCARARLRRPLTTPPTLAARVEEPWRRKRFAPCSLLSSPRMEKETKFSLPQSLLGVQLTR